MRGYEISLWIDERWYHALSQKLKDETVEDKLNDYLDELVNQLPTAEYNRISAEIYEEEQRERQQREEASRYAVFHVKEDGSEVYLQTDRGLEFMDAARMLRRYLRGESSASSFSQMLYHPEEITAEQFRQMAALRMENTGKVTGAFELDFDAQTMAALHTMDGWKVYAMKDVSTAVYYANRKQSLSEQTRWTKFLQRLDGRELTADTPDIFLHGQRKLTDEDISFSDEIMQNDNLLEFYMDVVFPPEEVFGEEVRTTGSGFVNLYVNYDMEKGQVCDTLDVYLVRDNDTEQPFKYRLNREECAALLPKMDAYCKQELGITLNEAVEQYLCEQTGPQMGPAM